MSDRNLSYESAYFLIEMGIDSDIAEANGESMAEMSSAVGIPVTSQIRLS